MWRAAGGIMIVSHAKRIVRMGLSLFRVSGRAGVYVSCQNAWAGWKCFLCSICMLHVSSSVFGEVWEMACMHGSLGTHLPGAQHNNICRVRDGSGARP